MTLNFEPIRLQQQADYLARLAKCGQIASDYSFINLLGWGEQYGLQWAWSENLVWIRQSEPFAALWAPVGDWSAENWPSTLAGLKPVAERMIRVPERLLHRWSELGIDLPAEETRGHWDYLYSVQDLTDLKGNRYHKKKNLLNQFINKYQFTYLPFGPAMIEQALMMQEDWCVWRDCENNDTLAAENKAIARVLYEWRSLQGITGGAILVEDVLVAYTVAETMPDHTLVIHFEKACPDHKGGYQAINQLFLAHAPQGYEVVNREQDLDDEGLRKAKLSYHPKDFVRKFQVSLG